MTYRQPRFQHRYRSILLSCSCSTVDKNIQSVAISPPREVNEGVVTFYLVNPLVVSPSTVATVATGTGSSRTVLSTRSLLLGCRTFERWCDLLLTSY